MEMAISICTLLLTFFSFILTCAALIFGAVYVAAFKEFKKQAKDHLDKQIEVAQLVSELVTEKLKLFKLDFKEENILLEENIKKMIETSIK